MKIKSNMQIVKRFRKAWRAGYCDLYYIFYTDDPTYYNCGVYGWNCDMYVDYKNDAILTTGYRNMRGMRIPSELLKKYDEKARRILSDKRYKSYESRRNALIRNKDAFLTELNNL